MLLTLFEIHFKGKEYINFNDMKQFFLELADQFQSDDVLEFLKEFMILQGKNKNVKVTQVASMISNDISGYPK